MEPDLTPLQRLWRTVVLLAILLAAAWATMDSIHERLKSDTPEPVQEVVQPVSEVLYLDSVRKCVGTELEADGVICGTIRIVP